jgi:hypothetical protein
LKSRLWSRLTIAGLMASAACLVQAQTVAQAERVPAAPAVQSVAAEVTRLPVDRQADWLAGEAGSGALERMDDAQLLAVFEAVDPSALRRYIQAGPNGFGSYTFTMWRAERIGGKWPATPDHMLVRIAHDPLRVYAKWLPDGAHAGQEVLYDASKRPGEMYGHLGGILGLMSIWSAVDGSLAKGQSNHSVTELGTDYIAKLFVSEGEKFMRAGVTRPSRMEVRTLDGVRVLALTYQAPEGSTGFYARKVTLGLDLRHPWFRSVESTGDDGQPFESIVIEHLEPRTFGEATFDPKNPDYRF